MGFLIDNILQNVAQGGYTSQELKGVVQYTLDPYFENKSVLHKYVLDNQILSMFGYVIAYKNNTLFEDGLKEVLKIYRSAFKINATLLFDIVLTTINEFGQKENLMWNVKASTPNNAPVDIYDATVTYMKHIGDTLELSGKLEIMEVYALIKLILEEKMNYETIRKSNFGLIIQNILDQNKMTNILKTRPISIKLSDWRNIAYHHSFNIEDKTIACYYGKNNNSFKINMEELRDYTGQIIRSCNIIDIARRIFLFEHAEQFEAILSEYEPLRTHDRLPMKMGQLKTSLLSQGFLISEYEENTQVSQLILKDLKNNSTLSISDLEKRSIHATQFLYNLWTILPNDTVRIIYCDAEGNKRFGVEVAGSICKEIADGKYELSYLVFHLIFEHIKNS